MMNNRDYAKTLNRLIELLYDSRDGYRECAEEVKDSYLKTLFVKLADLRSHMILELQDKARQLNVAYEKAGSTLAAGHRLFIDLKSMLTGGKADTLIEEIKRGEKYAIDTYQEALGANEHLPMDVQEIVRKQLAELQANLAQVKYQQPVS